DRPGDRAERPGLLRDARVSPARAPRPDDRLARGGVHVHHQYSPQLGASYAVEDCYRRFVAPHKDERHYVRVGRCVTVGLIALASALSRWLHNSSQAFQILLQIGAGTGSIFLLRWFWWRINAWSEIAGMAISFVVAVYFQFVHRALGLAALAPTVQLVIGVAVTTAGWLAVTFLTPPTDRATLQAFYDRIRPMGPGWEGAVTTRPANPGE